MAHQRSLLPRQPSKLQFFGPYLQERFMAEDSTLHEQQKEALKSLANWFGDDTTKDLTAVVVMPTGAGKSGVIACLPYTLGWAVSTGAINIDLNKPILVIAPGLDILNQLRYDLKYESNENCLQPFLLKRGFITQKDIYNKVLYSTYKIENAASVEGLGLSTVQYEIVLTNSQKWRRNRDGTRNYEDLPEDLFSVVIVDEAHHLPSKQWQEIVSKFKDYAKVIFFTATPKRHDGRAITEDFRSPGIDRYAYYLDRKEAIASRLIRPVEFSSIEQEGYPMRSVLHAIKEKMSLKDSECPLPGGKQHAALIIAKNIDQAYQFRDICQEDSIGFAREVVKVVHSETIGNKQERKEVVSQIHQHKYQVVIIVKMLLEGFDYPPFSVAGIVTRIRSPVKFEQFIGRVQRLVREPVIENEGIQADIITHDVYEQRQLFDEFISPSIPQQEKENID